MVAQDLAAEVGLLKVVTCLAQISRQALHALLCKLGLGRRDVFLRRLILELELLLDATHAGCERDSKREVGVRRRVGPAELDPRGLVLARLVHGHADKSRAVAVSPRRVAGHLPHRAHALVGIDGRVRDEGVLRCIAEHACDEVVGKLGEMVGVLRARAPEQVVAIVVHERLIEEHGRALGLRERLRHERREHVVREGLLLDHQAGGHDVVGTAPGLGPAELDAVLGRCLGVEGVLHRDGHALEHERRVAAQIAGGVPRREVEVSCLVLRNRLHGITEVEVLDARSCAGHIALLVEVLEDTRQHGTRISLERLAARRLDVAEHAGGTILARTPRQHLEGIGCRKGEHVGLLELGEAIDGRPIEADALIECLFEVFGRDREGLQVSEHIGEPKTDEADIALLYGTQDEVDIPIV